MPRLGEQGQPPATVKEEQPEMLLTGCLRSGGADTAVAGPSGRLYTLEVTEETSPAPAGSATPAGNATSSKVTYSLSASESIALAKHVDQVVELTGRLQAPARPVDQQKSSSPPATAQAKPGGAHRTFQVSALKAVASRKCP